MNVVILRAPMSRTTRPQTIPVGIGLEGPPAPPVEPGALRLETADLESKELQEITRDPEIFAAAPSMPMKLVEPLAEKIWPGSEAKAAWGVEVVRPPGCRHTGAGITVAILDTGIDAAWKTRPAFAGMHIETQNFTTDSDGSDRNGHGTHCAGTFFGQPADGLRIGVAPGVSRVLVGKVLGEKGGSTEWIVRGLLWAVQQGAHVISMSLGIDFTRFQERMAAEIDPRIATSLALAGYAANIRLFDRLSHWLCAPGGATAGAVVVAATGNESLRQVNPRYRVTVAPPAAGEAFLSVGALTRDNGAYVIAPFSNTGARVVAPGVDILSVRLGGGYSELSGTSMAAPHVAGVAALWAEKLLERPQARFDASRVIEAVKQSSLPLDHLDWDDVGVGLVQAPRT